MAESGLPIEPALPELCAAIRREGRAVLQAPPGAGKTTRVPLYLAEHAGFEGKILMLEPRRVAARSAAERLAEAYGEVAGGQVGYRMRGEAKPGRRIEVITEGLMTRMIQADPELAGISCIIFDEFHERALQSDLALALALEIRGALRPDLSILVMSATLDAGPVADLMDGAPVITSEGRAFPVETRWLDKPVKAARAAEFASGMAGLISKALSETEGGLLAFLPGRGEIARVAERLKGQVPGDVVVMELHGGLPLAAQRRAVLPLGQAGRKLVLATSIAETSLTLDGIRVVVDAGRARRARFDPGKGMARLVTERVSRAEAVQRAGRAGRLASGWAYRFWTKGEEGAMSAFAPPEIEVADLAPFALDLAQWGARDPGDLPLLTRPSAASFAEARALLADLGALAPDGGLSDLGREMARVPAHPRLARMLIEGGGPMAPALAAILEAREGGGLNGADILPLVKLLRGARTGLSLVRGMEADLRQGEKRLQRFAGKDRGLSAGALLSLAFPDRIAMQRPGGAARYLLASGAGAFLEEGDALAGQRFLVAADLDGDRREARIRRALPIGQGEIRALHEARIEAHRICHWDKRHKVVRAQTEARLGALVLEAKPDKGAGDEGYLPALLEGLRDLGLGRLGWSRSARALQGRAEWARAAGLDLPDLSEDGLLRDLEGWLLPWMAGMRSLGDLSSFDPGDALRGWIGRDGLAELDRLVPPKFRAPTGTEVLIDYTGEAPVAAIRLQEVFGLKAHPVLGRDRVPLVLSLLSPAGRPVQTTADLPGFWAVSYADVRKDMRGRYPKHPWPEDPSSAEATRRAKPRRSS